ncbi:putative F-box protein At5g55150 [Rhododendron vialii]|uniref:putative F-box protein At5g55150 n=1 Tax=Rhododendron vialii TaxID=182163 RepID=UPI00265DF9C1|nr:putative F-box protein At5g55150 [Rhododendron vialii]
MNLLHPLSWVEIGLPHICTVKYYNEDHMKTNFIFIRKAVLSSSPSGSTKDGNYVVMVIYGGLGRLGFWRPGDQTWTTIEHPHTFDFEDITYYKDQFYGVDSWGDVFACDIGGHNQTPAQARGVGGIPRGFLYSKRLYPVELDGDLLIVVRDHLIDDLETYMYEPCSVDETIEESKIGYGVKEFQVFKVDLCNEMEWAKIKSLGDYALFVGDNASISVQASKFPRIKAYCIYYTDDCWRSYIHCK